MLWVFPCHKRNKLTQDNGTLGVASNIAYYVYTSLVYKHVHLYIICIFVTQTITRFRLIFVAYIITIGECMETFECYDWAA